MSHGGDIEGAAETCQRNCTEVLFFITKDFRLDYISVQGRALLIYCYLMTMIIVSRLFFFFYFFLLKKGCFCYIYVSFSWCSCDLNWWQRWGSELGWYRRIKCPADFTHSKISSHWRNKKCTRLPWDWLFFFPRHHVHSIML